MSPCSGRESPQAKTALAFYCCCSLVEGAGEGGGDINEIRGKEKRREEYQAVCWEAGAQIGKNGEGL